jgi:hypothetical protein
LQAVVDDCVLDLGALVTPSTTPLAGSGPPVYFAVALSTQPPAFGSAGFPGVWAPLLALEEAPQELLHALLLAGPAPRRGDELDGRDERPDAAVDGGLGRRGVVESDAVVRALVLQLLEAALGRGGAAVEPADHLRDALADVGIGRLAPGATAIPAEHGADEHAQHGATECVVEREAVA